MIGTLSQPLWDLFVKSSLKDPSKIFDLGIEVYFIV